MPLPLVIFGHFYGIYCRFYMPHGLDIDGNNSVWVTDVALHQVIVDISVHH